MRNEIIVVHKVKKRKFRSLDGDLQKVWVRNYSV